MPYSTTSRTEFRARLRQFLFNTFWSDAELNTFIDEAIRVWNTLTGYFRSKEPITLSPTGVNPPVSYSIPSLVAGGMILLRLKTTSTLPEVSLEELGQFLPDYQNDSGTPLGWVPLGLSSFLVHPSPASNTAAEAEVLMAATVPVLDADFIQVGEEDLDALVSYCRFLAAFKEGGEELQSSLPHLHHFLAAAAKYNSKLLKSAVFRKASGMPTGGQPDLMPPNLTTPTVR